MSNFQPKISGFTIVRNAVLLDYPFQESVRSILPLCQEFIICCGDSEDQTLDLAEELAAEYPETVRIVKTKWEREGQKGGFQLKSQTDAAIKECKGDWCFYIQADEAVHEADFGKILAAVEQAEKYPQVDGVVFDYLHFYGNYDYTMRGRNWYRKEVRLFKNRRGIEAFRDAQGFRKNGKRLLAVPSEARVFHYGYVRSSEGLQTKSQEMSRWWGEKPPTNEDAFQLKKHVGLRRFQGTHPATMNRRIQDTWKYCNPTLCKRKWNRDEFKNLVTLIWESIIPYRIGEFRNYDLV